MEGEDSEAGAGERRSTFPTDAQLILNYREIELTAVEAIREGRVIGDPILKKGYVDPHWSISAQGLIYKSPAGRFLEDAIAQIREVEPSISFVPPKSLHISLTEVSHVAQGGRKTKGIRAKEAWDYHDALQEHFSQSVYGPIRLRLYGVIPTLGPKQPGTEERTVTIVAAFLPERNNDSIFLVRQAIQAAVEGAGLNFSAIYKNDVAKPIFVALGRLAHSPQKVGGEIPLVGVIETVNNKVNTRPPVLGEIREISLISTTSRSYREPHGHVRIDPPIRLDGAEPSGGKHFTSPDRMRK
ncbi:MAG: hypothetical protein Q7S60_01010 [bacterium]|nr:hypothetical protein [bacterium]